MGSFTAKKVQSLIKDGTPGRYSDGNGLYLMIPGKGAPYWLLRYTVAGKRREMTLDKYADLSLAEARERAGRGPEGHPHRRRPHRRAQA